MTLVTIGSTVWLTGEDVNGNPVSFAAKNVAMALEDNGRTRVSFHSGPVVILDMRHAEFMAMYEVARRRPDPEPRDETTEAAP